MYPLPELVARLVCSVVLILPSSAALLLSWLRSARHGARSLPPCTPPQRMAHRHHSRHGHG